MEDTVPPTRRRGFLRGTLVFLGSALGLKAAGVEPAPKAVVDSEKHLRFYARTRSLNTHLPGDAAAAADRRGRRGALLTQPHGEQVGEYYATCLSHPGAFGVHLAESPGVDLQTFRLPQGTLFGAGANERNDAGGTVHAVLGGTGRYAGARGTFSLTPLRLETGGKEWVEIEINLIS